MKEKRVINLEIILTNNCSSIMKFNYFIWTINLIGRIKIKDYILNLQ